MTADLAGIEQADWIDIATSRLSDLFAHYRKREMAREKFAGHKLQEKLGKLKSTNRLFHLATLPTWPLADRDQEIGGPGYRRPTD